MLSAVVCRVEVDVVDVAAVVVKADGDRSLIRISNLILQFDEIIQYFLPRLNSSKPVAVISANCNVN